MSDHSQLDVVILCGGLGTRFREVDENTPKVLANIKDEPFLKLLLNYLIAQKLKRFVLCTGYKSEMVEEYLKAEYSDDAIELVFSKEDEPLGTGGAVKHARDKIQSACFFVLNGDCFVPLTYEAFFQFHKQRQALASLVAAPIDNSDDFGGLEFSDDKVDAFLEKNDAPSEFVNAGVYCFSKEVFEIFPQENKFSLEYDVFPKLIEKNLYGFKSDSTFYDIGTPERFQFAQKKIGEEINRAG